MNQRPTIIEHRISYAEAMALAWILDLVADRSRKMSCDDAADGFEACATTFRQSVAYSLDSIIEMSDTTIRNLTATVTAVGERLVDEASTDGSAASAWALIADELFYREDGGSRLASFFGQCREPEDLHPFVQNVVATFQAKLDGKIEGLSREPHTP
jgi:hypothetical protein